MELETEHVVPSNDADKISSVAGASVYVLITVADKVIGMYKIAIDTVLYFLEHRMILDEIDGIPAHMRQK